MSPDESNGSVLSEPDEDLSAEESTLTDPRTALAEWANGSDEWVRYLVRQVLGSRQQVSPEEVDYAYRLFRQEKSLDDRDLPAETPLQVEATTDERDQPLIISRISEVSGVNALVPGSVIEPHAGLTILFGENGTGKTGYARILKALADSRTADVVLGNIDTETQESQSAKIEYLLGGKSHELIWTGERGRAPFTRVSIFDSPSVNFHVDDELEYVYVPTVLALFSHVVNGIKAVQSKIDETVKNLAGGSTTLLGRFPKDSTVYPLVETLGASTDLADLASRCDRDTKADERIEALRRAVAALDANTIAGQVATLVRAERVLKQAAEASSLLVALGNSDYNGLAARRASLESDYSAFRSELFKAAQLPADPEETWEAFVASGDAYRQHLVGLGLHDSGACLYCRQNLDEAAAGLVAKYSDYLEDKIKQDMESADAAMRLLAAPLDTANLSEAVAYIDEYQGRSDKPEFFSSVHMVLNLVESSKSSLLSTTALPEKLAQEAGGLYATLSASAAALSARIKSLKDQEANRESALAEKRKELNELISRVELTKSWPAISSQVQNAKEADRLRILSRALPILSRNVTDLSKSASDQLINQSFDKLFGEECKALRAPTLTVEFVGRHGKAQRRKVLSGRHKPSKILSEGEQKVLAMADFLAEARLAGITAPVIFDDPVSSLDHRRIKEVASRVARLADDCQVIVFTHDIFFATTLLSHFDANRRCSYFQITDDEGKGRVTRATGPRWDTLKNLTKNINETILAAQQVDGEARDALVRTGYDWIRSWCEVFTETVLLKGVTQRYQPNVRMTLLPRINAAALPAAIEVVNRVFEDACRFIDGHSQPLPTLGVSPTLSALKTDWQDLQDCKKSYESAQG